MMETHHSNVVFGNVTLGLGVVRMEEDTTVQEFGIVQAGMESRVQPIIVQPGL